MCVMAPNCVESRTIREHLSGKINSSKSSYKRPQTSPPFSSLSPLKMVFPMCKFLVLLVFFVVFPPSLCAPENPFTMSHFGSNLRPGNFFNPTQIHCHVCNRILFGTQEINGETCVIQNETANLTHTNQRDPFNPLHRSNQLSLHASPSTSHPPSQTHYSNVNRLAPQRNLASTLNQPLISFQNQLRQEIIRRIIGTTRQPIAQPPMQMANTRAIQPFFSFPNPQDPLVRAINARLQQQQQQIRPHRRRVRRENMVHPNALVRHPVAQIAPDVIDLQHDEDDGSDNSISMINVDLNL